MAIYKRSLELLQSVKSFGQSFLTKSGIMVGLGEREDDVISVFKDLKKAGLIS
jgi:lipoic acid synthetase